MTHAFSRILLRMGAITSLALGWRTSAAQSAAGRVRVLVSRREARVVFAKDTARTWGWSARKDPDYFPSYVWGIAVEGMDGTRMLWLRLDGRADEARHFPSIDSLVAAARAERCFPGMIARCTDSAMHASVERGQIVLTLRDSAKIARLFGMRPPSVQAWHRGPDEVHDSWSAAVRVEYVAPTIPPPTAATRLDAARSRRRYEASITTISRYIKGREPWRPLWLENGDSVAVSVGEMRCHHDSCSSGEYAGLRDSGWTILDTTIARVQRVLQDSSDDIEILIGGRERTYVKALRAGRTILRVGGVHGPSDTAASSTPPAHQIEREIIVTPPIGRVEIVPRPDSVRALETVTLSVRVLDREGHEVTGLPWQLEVLDGDTRGIRLGPAPVPLVFNSAGRTRITVRLGPHTDSLSILVVPPNGK